MKKMMGRENICISVGRATMIMCHDWSHDTTKYFMVECVLNPLLDCIMFMVHRFCLYLYVIFTLTLFLAQFVEIVCVSVQPGGSTVVGLFSLTVSVPPSAASLGPYWILPPPTALFNVCPTVSCLLTHP